MIWIHIGSPKTGTTALQNFLHLNEDLLRKSGVNYVRGARSHISHNPLATALTQGKADAFLEAIAKEASENPDIDHIISSEVLFRIVVARKLQAKLPESLRENVKVICYLRPQDSYAEVMYKQLLKNGRISPDRQAFLSSFRPRLNYTTVLDAYAQIFGAENILVRPFARDKLVNNDVIDDFLHLVGVDRSGDFQEPPKSTNKSLSVELSEMLSVVGGKLEVATRDIIREIIRMDIPGTIRSGDVYSIAEKQTLMEDLRAENEKLVEKYSPDNASFFGVERRETAEVPDVEPSSKDTRNEALGALFQAINALQTLALQKASEVEPPEEPKDDRADLPPTWYREIYPGGEYEGFYHKLGNYAASFVDRGKEHLLISFDNLHNAGNRELGREPWAQKFCSDNGWSHLGVYAQASTWFRDQKLIDFLDGLKAEGFFESFASVSLAGTSMGGFAALTFASLAPGSTVIAFSPQTTLDENLVPWEHRFAKGRAADWALPYSDAAEQIAKAGKVYVVYDPFMENDKKHVERLTGDNLVFLRGFGIGHKSALMLNRMGHLKSVMEGGIANTLGASDFYELIRDRKSIYMYRMNMEGYLADRGKESLIPAFRDAFVRRRRQQKRNAQKS